MQKNRRIKFWYIFAMCILFVYILLLITRVIAFPTFAYTAYFKVRESDFERIAHYAESTRQPVYCYNFGGELHRSNISDRKTDKSVSRIYNSIMLENINGGVNNFDKGIQVHFSVDFLISFNGMPCEICYSSEKPHNTYNYSSGCCEVVEYKEILGEDNWYIAFRRIKKGTG